MAQPVISANELSFNGFGTDGVTDNGDGSYTVKLIEGRNIVKLTSASGTAYQVLTAKAVNYTVSNLTNPEEQIKPGDQISVKFNTLYHPCGKLAGIYNMVSGIQYNNIEANVSLYGGLGQYTFASKAQEYKITIPQEFEEAEFVLSNGVIKTNGYGSPFGDHRKITLETGAAPNMNAAAKIAYFGALPVISISLEELRVDPTSDTLATDNISVYPNPFADYIIVNASAADMASIYNLSGAAVANINLVNGSNRIETSALPKGIYVLKVGETTVKIVK